MSERIPVTGSFDAVLEEHGVVLSRGWDEMVRDGLIAGAKEPFIAERTPNDTRERFASPEAAEAWHSNEVKRPTVYTLNQIGDTAIGGVIWFSHQTLPDVSDHTFAIRMYESLRGRRLAGFFLDAAHEDYAKLTNEATTWLTTPAEDNNAALNLYSTHGYKYLQQQGRRHIMLRDPRAIRIELENEYTASHDLNNL